jgi:hypothetical protein
MARVHRLRTTDRIFFVTVNLRRQVQGFAAPAYHSYAYIAGLGM